MEYQLTKKDQLFLDKIEREEKEMLWKFYDLTKSDANCPKNPYLLQPKNLRLVSYEILPNKRVKLNIGYMEHGVDMSVLLKECLIISTLLALYFVNK